MRRSKLPVDAVAAPSMDKIDNGNLDDANAIDGKITTYEPPFMLTFYWMLCSLMFSSSFCSHSPTLLPLHGRLPLQLHLQSPTR